MYEITIRNKTGGEITTLEAELILMATVNDCKTQAQILSVAQSATTIYTASAAVAIEDCIQKIEEEKPGFLEIMKKCRDYYNSNKQTENGVST